MVMLNDIGIEILKGEDPALFQALFQERQRQEAHIELIASENYASSAILALQGSILTNKYAEGYPHKRYYGGCEFVDQVEEIAIERAKQLFKADYANVQPHSGSQANSAAFSAFIQPGDKVLGMSLAEGGHLTHGSPVNFSGKLYQFSHYGVSSQTHLIDYDQVRELAKKNQPKLIVAGFSAYSRILDWKIFREIADEIGAYLMVDMAHVSGLVAAGLYPSPIPYADVVTSTTHKTLRGPRGGFILAKAEHAKALNSAIFPGNQGGPLMHVIAAKARAFFEAMQPEFLQYQKQVLLNACALSDELSKRDIAIVSGGTDNHLLLLNLIGHSHNGKQLEEILGHLRITVNKNAIPGDPLSPFLTSGIRIGSPAITTRGFKENECRQIAGWLSDVIQHPEDHSLHQGIFNSVRELCERFPVYSQAIL